MNQTINLYQQNPLQLKTSKRWYKRWWGILLLIFFLYFFIVLISLFFSASSSPAYPSTNVAVSSAATQNKVNDSELYLNTADDPVVGSKEAKVKIVEFSDFQCPYSRQSFSVVREILQRYGDKIYFVYRDFPVAEIHPEATIAAQAAQCAAEQGKFWEMHDKLFISQESLAAEDLKKYARALGLNTALFNRCLTEERYQEEVVQDLADGVNLGVKGTPTFFINGYRVQGSIPKTIFIKIIEQALAEN